MNGFSQDGARMLSAEGVDCLIGRVEPIRKHGNWIWLSMPSAVVDRAVRAAGFERDELLQRSAYPKAYLEPSSELLDVVNDRCGVFYQATAETMDNFYYLKLVENNKLFVSYQKIIGGRHIATLTDAQVSRLVELVTEQLAQVRERRLKT